LNRQGAKKKAWRSGVPARLGGFAMKNSYQHSTGRLFETGEAK
jgi:hypothetical protein